jgi:hypothetical protein
LGSAGGDTSSSSSSTAGKALRTPRADAPIGLMPSSAAGLPIPWPTAATASARAATSSSASPTSRSSSDVPVERNDSKEPVTRLADRGATALSASTEHQSSSSRVLSYEEIMQHRLVRGARSEVEWKWAEYREARASKGESRCVV